MSYGSGPAPYGEQPPYGGQAPYGGGPTPYGAPQQFGQFGPLPLTPDIAPLPGASFSEAVKRFFQRYAQFRGYASRSEYWWVALFNSLVILGFYLLAFIFISLSESSDSTGAGIGFIVVGLLYMLYGLAIFIPSLALTVRRLHDNGKSGLWLLLGFVPGGSIALLVFFCMESRPDLYRPEWS
ncbi:DUF805 domain-containing protein [Actinomyces viscosus]|uniref:Inner membrane protein yhaI n=1 Tax=Actinomyces viscosus TaxID=1656 RepID=A0A3S4Z7U3_ACTVI|nr:DUF805 domain-containing protein [Actinomyces viscosus]TFH51237.1 DUF805 domain-containing protein [Actinomyces viscosus]VEI15027.1 Inner membrane protein yhaI [Actinomyces viscosus]